MEDKEKDIFKGRANKIKRLEKELAEAQLKVTELFIEIDKIEKIGSSGTYPNDNTSTK